MMTVSSKFYDFLKGITPLQNNPGQKVARKPQCLQKTSELLGNKLVKQLSVGVYNIISGLKIKSA